MVKVTKVRFGFSESSYFQKYHSKGVEFPSILDANAFLFRLSMNSTHRLGYDKTDFEIHFEDGYVYAGRYDVHSHEDRQENPNGRCDLADHVRAFCTFYAGMRCPPHMKQDAYENLLKSVCPTQEMRDGFRLFLERYDLSR